MSHSIPWFQQWGSSWQRRGRERGARATNCPKEFGSAEGHLSSNWQEESALDLPAFWQEDISEVKKQETANPFSANGASPSDKKANTHNSNGLPFGDLDLAANKNIETPPEFFPPENSQGLISEEFNFQLNNVEDET